MILFLITIFYILLSIIQGLLIILLPPIWKFKRFEIVAWPLYSAWGIGWVITGTWLLLGLPFEWWWKFVVIFHSCFPVIFIAAQLNNNMEKLKLFIAKALKGVRNESRI